MTAANCPLCGNNNNCENLSSNDNKTCWCRDRTISFPSSLLALVPDIDKDKDKDKDKACICKTCSLSHNSNLYQSI